MFEQKWSETVAMNIRKAHMIKKRTETMAMNIRKVQNDTYPQKPLEGPKLLIESAIVQYSRADVQGTI